jgi:undecaprenyl-diphosphatase
MLETLLEWDRIALIFLNMSGSHTPFLDFFMWMTTRIFIWLPAFLVFFYVIVKDKRKESLLILGSVIILFVLCDQITSSILKPLIARPRPSRDLAIMDFLQYVNDYRGGRFGFPSSHAANSFGFAMLTSLLLRYRWYTVVAFSWAALCTYTRLYLGVHYPSDILVGMILGVLIGWLCYLIYRKVRKLMPHFIKPIYVPSNHTTSSGYTITHIRFLILSLAAVLFCIISCAVQAAKFIQ